ncbi:hypothetical protein UFOVP671_13 [uncultured Caudovirales phage]|uniref:Uncharacterized protein n=1 Tax=uncultured Caudovirales phage TaxID=2100421 RepID=A0A6J5NEX0_9CAUD|nr:hypothetical protein UFOVP671_13 [uncultured Caudovirales phage]
MLDQTQESFEQPSDIGTSDEAIARRWKLELSLAGKRDRAWLKSAERPNNLYANHKQVENSFNILWSNTETLRYACYNSLPEPQCRPRYLDSDELSDKVSDVLNRSLSFCLDSYDFDDIMQKDVLTMLLSGRAISRIRYIPEIHTAEGSADLEEEDKYEELTWERCEVDRVNYKDFRILCDATKWNDVTAIGFRHYMTRAELKDKFGEEHGNKIPLDKPTDDDVNKSEEGDLFKTAAIWEIWDKEQKKIFWICETYPVPCKIQEDMLGLQQFFPIPRPLYAIENSNTLEPTTLFSQYEEQVKELNRISTRINKLVSAIRVRGIYDGTLTEMSRLMQSSDNDLIPADNVMPLIERGGLDKAIWMMPIDTAAAVLKELYVQREATKQIIYEITGISDIMRAATDPKETYGAQRIKSTWGTQRLQRMQKEVQRYARDIMRIKAEVISTKFHQETLEKMTLIKLPMQRDVDAQVQQMMFQYHQQALMAQQQGQQPPPPPQPPNVVTWDAVIRVMSDNVSRDYTIDIETDSTLSAIQDNDMDALKNLLGGMAQLIQGFGPAVQAGAIPIEVVKELMGVVVRRAKLGSAVEDAFDKLKQPAPPPDPHKAEMEKQQAQMQSQMQIEQMKAQLGAQKSQVEVEAKLKMDQMAAQHDMMVEQQKQQMQAAQIQHQNELEAQRKQMELILDARLDAQKVAYDQHMQNNQMEFDRWKAELDASTKLAIAELTSNTTLQAKQLDAAMAAAEGKKIKDDEESGKSSKKEPQVVNIHIPRGKATVRKNEDGSYTREDQ